MVLITAYHLGEQNLACSGSSEKYDVKCVKTGDGAYSSDDEGSASVLNTWRYVMRAEHFEIGCDGPAYGDKFQSTDVFSSVSEITLARLQEHYDCFDSLLADNVDVVLTIDGFIICSVLKCGSAKHVWYQLYAPHATNIIDLAANHLCHNYHRGQDMEVSIGGRSTQEILIVDEADECVDSVNTLLNIGEFTIDRPLIRRNDETDRLDELWLLRSVSRLHDVFYRMGSRRRDDFAKIRRYIDKLSDCVDKLKPEESPPGSGSEWD